ncbi:hypothetical protein ACF0H5_020210 [Mactra antiquata]
MSSTVIIAWILFRDTANYFLDGVERCIKKRMADVEVQKCLDYLLEQKNDLEVSSFGCNRQSVYDASSKHSVRQMKLAEYIKTMDKLKVKHTLSDEELQALYGTYHTVQTLADKKSGCFKVMTDISLLEEQIQNLSSEFDTKAVQLVEMSLNNKSSKHQNGLNNESMARTTQNCISGVRKSWKWADEVMQCAHVHLANAAAYHEFFHEVEEVDYWMNNIMSKIHLSFSRKQLQGDRTDLTDINDEMRDTLLAYLRWQSKVDSLFSRARDIVPVYKRTTPIKDSCSVLALASYKTNEIEFNEGDALTLLNNANQSKWQVKNAAGQVAIVPAVILLINGPTGEAIDAALRLRLQLLGLWTTSVKRLGFQMIAFMQLVFKDWTKEEIQAIQSMKKSDRDELLRILLTTEKTLQENWDGYEGFEELQERISRLRTILDEVNEKPSSDTKTPGEVIIQIKMIEDLLNRYQEFWTYWETYKVSSEVLRQPKYLLVCDKWDQLHYKTSAHFVRFWDTNLLMPNQEGKTYKAEAALTIHETPKSKLKDESIQSEAVEELMTSESANRVDSTISDALATLEADEDESSSSTDITEIRKRQQLTTDEVVSTTEEVRHTYVIKKVVDPRNEELLTLTEAVLAGIIDQASGQYVNIVTGESMPLSQAMACGDIIVEFKSQKKIKEEKSSYGIITIKTSVETRPYTILSVIDPSTEKEITTEEAYSKGILSKTDSSFTTKDGEKVTIMDAIYGGMIKVEFHGDEQDSQEETKTYAVNAVVDQKLKEKVSFHDAVQKGLLDGEEGVYVHNVTWEKVPITEAIMRGFIKAKIITDTSKLDIDPTNKIVVRKLSIAREKILGAVKVARAFKSKAGKTEVNGKLSI